MTAIPAATTLDRHLTALVERGITAAHGVLPLPVVDRLHADVMAAFEEARSREGGTVPRGPERWYVEVNPEQLHGFVDLVTHPWVTSVCEAVLGPDYRFVEIGFDVPFPGAVDQPWHRDFTFPTEEQHYGRLTSLAFNVTTVDTTPESGQFEIAPGTHWEPGRDWDHGMFPPRSQWPRLEAVSELRMPQRGDISARSALALHRGTAHRGHVPRPVVVLGATSGPEAAESGHRLTVTRELWSTFDRSLRGHLWAEVVDEYTPVVQRHDIEGLVMGA